MAGAGWYPDPAGSGDERYWDGSGWSGDLRPPRDRAAFAPQRPAPEPYYVAPVAPPLPAKQRRGWRTWQLLAVGVVALIVGVAIGQGGSKSTPEAAVSSAASPGAATTPDTAAKPPGAPATAPQRVASSSSNSAHPPQDDVSLTTCAKDSIGYVSIGGTIVNHTSKTSDYSIHVSVYNPAGVRVSEATGFETKVQPGGTAVWQGSGDKETQEQVTCKLDSVDRSASL